MRDLDEFKIKNPGQRFNRIQDLKDKLEGNEHFDKWNIELSQEMATVQSEVLRPPQLLYQNQLRSWDDYNFRKIKHSQPIQLKQETWCLVHGENDGELASDALENMEKACRAMGIVV